MASLALTSVVTRGQSHVETDFADQTLMMNLDLGKYYAVTDVAKRIWDLLAQPTSLADVCSRLQQEFDVEAAECQRDVLDFAMTLKRNGLIVECAP